MDREFAEVLYRAVMMIARYLEKRYSLGMRKDEPWIDTSKLPARVCKYCKKPIENIKDHYACGTVASVG